MPRWAGVAIFLAMALLFLIANRGAYEGWFSGDDLDNIAWTRLSPARDYAAGAVTPLYQPQNFRPAGHFYFFMMYRLAGLQFPWYVAVIHVLHFAAAVLLWMFLRRMEMQWIGAAAGVLFFVFHMAVFDAYWKPMYIFDVLCGLFSLASLLAWSYRRWIFSFVCFWLAYKSKEIAIALPAVLALYEFSVGQRRWKLLLPFFAVSLSFGVQALFLNPNIDNEYTLRFTPAALWTTISFYSSKILLIPYAGLAIALLLTLRDRRVRFGVGAFALLLAPMLFVPGRLFGAYLYVPLAALAVAAGAIAARARPPVIAAAVILWLPFNYWHLRLNRRAALAAAQENRAYYEQLERALPPLSGVHSFIYDGVPQGLSSWGILASLRLIRNEWDIKVHSVDENYAGGEAVALLSWDSPTRTLYTASRKAEDIESSYITMTRGTPVWQLEKGWYSRQDRFRWTRPYAVARLYRPKDAAEFELQANIGPNYISRIGRVQVEVVLNGRALERREFVEPGWQTVRWPLPSADPGPVRVEFKIRPEFRPPEDPRSLGLPIGAFGFVATGTK
jgi:hypothetical protein